MQLFRSKMTEQSPQYSVCLNHDYEQLQDWMNRTVYNANYGAPGNLHSEILTCYDEGVAWPDRGACPQSMIRLGRLEKLRVATQRRGSEEPNRWGIRNGRDGNLRLWRYRQQYLLTKHADQFSRNCSGAISSADALDLPKGICSVHGSSEILGLDVRFLLWALGTLARRILEFTLSSMAGRCPSA